MPTSRATAAYANYNPTEDDLLQAARAVQALDALDSMARRDQQAAFQQAGLDLREKEMQLNRTQEARMASQQQFTVEQQIAKNTKEARSNSALAVINQQLPILDFNNPEHEAQYGKLKSLARENFVDDQGMQTTFGAYDEVLGRKKVERNTLQASQLGEEGYAVYDALVKNAPGLDTSKALRLAKNSEQAKSLYFWWQDYAAKNGVAFAPDANERASLTKKIGFDSSTSAPVVAAGTNTLGQTQSFDLREEIWDIEAVNNLVAKHITPKLKAVEDAKAATTAAATSAWLADQQAGTRSKNASAQKAETEAAVLRGRNSYIFQTPQAAQSGGDTDVAEGSPTLQNGLYGLFNKPPAPTPTPAPTK